jgi:hypothetical protein
MSIKDDFKLLEDVKHIPRHFIYDIIAAYKQHSLATERSGSKDKNDTLENRYMVVGMISKLYGNYFRIQQSIITKYEELKDIIEQMDSDKFINIVNKQVFKLGYRGIEEKNIDIIVCAVIRKLKDMNKPKEVKDVKKIENERSEEMYD